MRSKLHADSGIFGSGIIEQTCTWKYLLGILVVEHKFDYGEDFRRGPWSEQCYLGKCTDWSSKANHSCQAVSMHRGLLCWKIKSTTSSVLEQGDCALIATFLQLKRPYTPSIKKYVPTATEYIATTKSKPLFSFEFAWWNTYQKCP